MLAGRNRGPESVSFRSSSGNCGTKALLWGGPFLRAPFLQVNRREKPEVPRGRKALRKPSIQATFGTPIEAAMKVTVEGVPNC